MPNPINKLKSFNLDPNSTFTFGGINISNIANVNIPGGSNGYVLSTNGSGGLSWTAQTGGSGGGGGDPFLSVVDSFTGDGTENTFTLSVSPAGSEYTLVMIGGVTQPRSSYTISGSDIIFSSPPPNQAIIEITILGGSATLVGTATTVTSNYQPNITSVGTLTSLTVSGNITANSFVGNLNGTAQTATTVTSSSQSNITSVGTLANLTVTGNITTSGTFVGNGSGITNAGTAINVVGSSQPNITSVGTLTELNIAGAFSSASFSEPVTVLSNAVSVVAHNYSLSSTFIHLTPVANFTANFTNVPSTNNKIVVVALIIYQGAIAYIPNTIQLSGFTYTPKWANGVPPAGSPNKVDVFSFSLVRYNDGWDIFGQLSTYGAV